MAGNDDRPEWWTRSAELKSELNLPEYEPPRFSDGTYVHEVVERLEETHECTIQFGAVNPRYPDDWFVWIDGEQAFAIGRSRTIEANTRYEMTAAEFREAVEPHLQ
jgi:hypothetical protein